MVNKRLCGAMSLVAALLLAQRLPAYAQDEPRGRVKFLLGGLKSGGDTCYILGIGVDSLRNPKEDSEFRSGVGAYAEMTSKQLGDAAQGLLMVGFPEETIATLFINYNAYSKRVFFTTGIGLSVSTRDEDEPLGFAYNAGIGVCLSSKLTGPDLRLRWVSHANGRLDGLSLALSYGF